MTVFDLVNLTVGTATAIGAVIAARRMSPDRVHYLDRVGPSTRDVQGLGTATPEIQGCEQDAPAYLLSVDATARDDLFIRHLKRSLSAKELEEALVTAFDTSPCTDPERLEESVQEATKRHQRMIEDLEKRMRRLEEQSV